MDAGDFRVDYNRMDLMGGAEFEWMISTTIGFTGGVVSYVDNAYAGRDTREVIARLRVSRSF